MAGLGGVKTRSFPAAALGGVKTWSFYEGPSSGGGRGRYTASHGDYPAAALRSMRKDDLENGEPSLKTEDMARYERMNRRQEDGGYTTTDDDDFIIIHYNIQSLIRFEERIERVLYGLGNSRWDVLVFTETCREDQSE